MRYLLLIYTPETHYMNLSPEDNAALLAEWGRFSAEVGAAGVLRGADRLRPTSFASTVRVRSGKAATTDGPFAETKEQLGGYYMIEVDDLDQAVAWARKMPAARVGSVEVRPIWPPEEYRR